MRNAKSRKATTTVIAFLALVSLFIAFSGSSRIQRKTKRTVSKIIFHPTSVTPPVEYSNLTVRGKRSEFSSMFEEGNRKLEKPLRQKEEFEEEDDFWEQLSFDVTNVSDKTIFFIRTYVFMYTDEGVRSGKRQSGATIDFGNPFSPSVTSLRPEETITLRLDPMMIDYVRQKNQQLSSPIIRIGIYADSVYFEDGYKWGFDGKLYKTQQEQKQSSLKNQSGAESKISGISTNRQTKENSTAGVSDFRAFGAGLNLFGFTMASLLPANSRLANFPVPSAAAIVCGQYCHVRDPMTPEETVACENVPNTTCTTTKPKWVQTTPSSNSYGLTPGLPKICHRPNETQQCGSLFTEFCDVDGRCGPGESEPSNYCGVGSSCNPTYSELNSCNGSWSCSTCECLWGSPVLIDIEGNRFALTDAARGVNFDIKGDGKPLRWSWTAPNSDDAWLALDRNGNGKIDNGAELFGNWTEQPDPPAGTGRNGFLALAVFDKPEKGGNGDGKINRRDAIFYQLRLWQDKNHNGISEAYELHTLSELGVETFRLDYQQWGWLDQYDNLFKYRAKVHDSQGAQIG